MKTVYTVLAVMVCVVLFTPAEPETPQKTKLNQLQLIGSHNSYKIRIEEPLMDYLMKENPALSSLEYEHIPLSDQLDLGLRGLELDVFYDPNGGYYANPRGLATVESMDAEPQPFDVEEKLQVPGLKVFHVQEIDFRSHHLLLKDALEELKSWSQAHQGHTPIIITLNAKDSEIPRTRKPLPFTAQALQSIDSEIRAVLDEERLITPDRVRGNFETLEQAVLA